MTRFERLEFDDNKRVQRSTGEGETIRDELYFHDQGQRYWLAGDFDLALQNYSRAVEKNNVFFPGWLGQVQMLVELTEYREAVIWADKALELFPQNPQLLAVKSVACSRDGRIAKALALSDSSVVEDNITACVWLARAEVLLNRGSRIAESCISKAIATAGDQVSVVCLEAGRLLCRQGSFAQAMQHLNKAVDGLPKSALAWYALGYCQARLGRPEAVDTLKQSLKLQPTFEPARKQLHRVENKGLFRKLFGG